MKKVFVCLLFACLLSGNVWASGTTEQNEKSDELKIGLVQIDLSHPFHLGEVEGAKEAARRYGFQLLVTSGEGDATKQIQAFENLLAQKVDAVAVNFIDSVAFAPAIKKANEAGIPVIALHSKVDGCVTTLGFDEWYTGNSVGEYAVSLLKKHKDWDTGVEVANLQGLLGQGLNEARSGGFVEIMEKYPDNIKVVALEPTDWQPLKAVDIMENWLVAYPGLDLVYGNSDSLTIPAADITATNGRNDILFVSVDGSDFALEAIRSGKIKSTFLYAAEYTGYWKAWIPYRIAIGEKVPEEMFIKGTLVNADNVGGIIKLSDAQKNDMAEFPFEKPLTEIISQYLD